MDSGKDIRIQDNDHARERTVRTWDSKNSGSYFTKKEHNQEIERKMKEKNNYWPKVRDSKLLDF